MLLSPKNFLWKKSFSRRKRFFKTNKLKNVITGSFQLVALEKGKINNKQLESLRRVLRRTLKKQAKIWIKPFPNNIVTKKPPETRMGKGKANLKIWVCMINKGETLVEIKGCFWKQAKLALLQIKCKLSLKAFINLEKKIFY